MSDIVLEQCSKYYPTNPIFIFQHNVRHCIERSYMYVRNSQKNVSQSNPIFNFHDNVKPAVDESPPLVMATQSPNRRMSVLPAEAGGTHSDGGVMCIVPGVFYRDRFSFLTGCLSRVVYNWFELMWFHHLCKQLSNHFPMPGGNSQVVYQVDWRQT